MVGLKKVYIRKRWSHALHIASDLNRCTSDGERRFLGSRLAKQRQAGRLIYIRSNFLFSQHVRSVNDRSTSQCHASRRARVSQLIERFRWESIPRHVLPDYVNKLTKTPTISQVVQHFEVKSSMQSGPELCHVLPARIVHPRPPSVDLGCYI